jgi:RNA polymerase sigma-32 factor
VTRTMIARPRIFLTEDDEKVLVARMLTGDRGARDRLIEAHLPLAAKFAKRYDRICSAEDLTQEAFVGLIKAADHFDPTRGARFATCAMYWIKTTLNEYVRANFSVVGVPNTQRAKRDFTEGLRTGTLRFDASLDAPISRANETSRVETLADDNLPDESGVVDNIDRDARVAAVRRALDQLTPRERDIIMRRHLTDDPNVPTFRDLADELGVSRQRIQQLEDRALRRMLAILRREAVTRVCRGYTALECIA